MVNPNQSTEKEIDLSLLIKKSANSLGKLLGIIYNFLLRCFSYLLLFAFRNVIILGVTFLLGATIGIGIYFISEKNFQSDMVLQSNEIPTEDMIAKINELGIYAGEGNYKVLAEKLKVDTLHTKMIKSIGAYWFIDEDRDKVADMVDYKRSFNAIKDTVPFRVMDLLDVRATVSNPEAFEILQDGIITFLKSDARLALMNGNRTQGLEEKISRIDAELLKLDRLQNYEYFEKEKEMNLDLGNLGSLKVLGEEKDTRLLHDEIIRLQDARISLERQLQVTGEMVSVITGFPVSVKSSKGISFEGIFYGIVFMVLAYILLFVLEHRKRVVSFLESQS